ncbi:MAG: pyruvate kinase [Gammaproteobacteria bacterium]|nr:MAG: pyruvate kinase [Gammaproteobacteria bacterium]
MAIDTDIQLLKKRRTKIVATLGPASDSPEVIARLIQAGVNVFRLNMSHGEHETHQRNFQRLRDAAAAANSPIAVLADLCGPKIRVGRFAGGSIDLADGEEVTITTREVEGKPGLIPSQYTALAGDVKEGDRVLLADGVMELRVEDVQGTEIKCRVMEGGKLGDRKGINLPGVNVSAPSLTEKDRVDAEFALNLGVDFIALSFVRSAKDVQQLKDVITEHSHHAAIVAKIERPEALEDSEAVIKTADAIMVARGDLGVELPPEQVPVAQLQLIDQARRFNRPVIVATQMLESMIENARPTRAEVADVSLTVASGADAVMLSAETAAGAHPVQAVEMMNRIARQTEGYLWRHGAFGSIALKHDAEEPLSFGDALARSTAQLSRDLLVRAVLVVSQTGRSTTTVSSARPAAPVIAVTSSPQTCRRMNLLWGVLPVDASKADLKDPIALARRVAQEEELAGPGDTLLVVRGFNTDTQRNTPSVTVVSI